MTPSGLPIPLIKGAMHVIPAPVMKRLIGIMMRRIERRHPQLFSNLAKLELATILIEPTDLPYRFALTVGKPKPSFVVADKDFDEPLDAQVRGPLKTLMDMLEARSDGDMLFFARGIAVSGDTSVLVALRNTLDREEINLLDEVMSFFGPLAKPAAEAMEAIERLVQRMKENRKHED